MRFGFVVPWADADAIGDLAATAEASGWDGLFVWEPVWGVDAWICLALAATRTSTIRLGTMLTPPSRRRPWELASQVATVDRLSRRAGHAVGRPRSDRQWLRRVRRGDRSADPRRAARRMPRHRHRAVGRATVQLRPARTTRSQPTEFPTIGETVQQPRVPIWCVGMIGRPEVDGQGVALGRSAPAAGRRQATRRSPRSVRSASRSAIATTTSSSRARATSTPRRPGRRPARRGGSSRCGAPSTRSTPPWPPTTASSKALQPDRSGRPAVIADWAATVGRTVGERAMRRRDRGWNYAEVWEAVARRLPDAPAQRHAGSLWTWREFDRTGRRHRRASPRAGRRRAGQGRPIPVQRSRVPRVGVRRVQGRPRRGQHQLSLHARRADLPLGQRRRRRRRLPRRVRRPVRDGPRSIAAHPHVAVGRRRLGALPGLGHAVRSGDVTLAGTDAGSRGAVTAITSCSSTPAARQACPKE